MKSKITAMLLGGLFLGFVSAIPIVGWLWFVWAILGGIAAVFVYRAASKAPTAQIAEGLTIGAGAGVAGGVLMFVLVLIFSFLMALYGVWAGRPAMPFFTAIGETLEFLIEKNAMLTVMQLVMSLVIAVINIGFATLGGFLGWLFFYRSSTQASSVSNYAPTSH